MSQHHEYPHRHHGITSGDVADPGRWAAVRRSWRVRPGCASDRLDRIDLLMCVIARLGGAVLSMLLVSIVTFLLMRIRGRDAADGLVGEQGTAEQVQLLRQRLVLDRPLIEQYGDWLTGFVRGDLGTSIATDRPVSDLLKAAAPATLSMTAFTLALAATVGVAAGAVAGLRKGSNVDRVVSLGTTLGVAMPSYWVALPLVTFFSLNRTWFPATGIEHFPPASAPGSNTLSSPRTRSVSPRSTSLDRREEASSTCWPSHTSKRRGRGEPAERISSVATSSETPR